MYIMNISRGKIKKLRRSKSQSRRKLPKNKKRKDQELDKIEVLEKKNISI